MEVPSPLGHRLWSCDAAALMAALEVAPGRRQQVATRRRRRLTLAVSLELAEVEEELSASLLAADVAVEKVHSPPDVHRRHSALAFQPQSATQVKWAGWGSHFWALAGDESSDEEGEDQGKESPGSGGGGKFLNDALLVGFSVDEVRRAEVLATDVVLPVFGSVDCGPGQVR